MLSSKYKDRLEVASKYQQPVLTPGPLEPPAGGRTMRKRRDRLYETVLKDMKKLETRLKKTTPAGDGGGFRTRPPRLEVYVDSDRAAGVSMHSRDIKKQIQRINDVSHVQVSSRGLEHLWHVYRSTGNAFTRKQEYAKALVSFNHALELDISYEGIFLDRCHCHLALGNLEEALADAQSALTIEASQIQAKLMKAMCHFRLGEFEFAAVWYHRFLRVRPVSTLTRDARFGLSSSEMALNDIVDRNLSDLVIYDPRIDMSVIACA